DALPVTGQLYGGKSTLNLEQLLSCEPQVIIDLGDRKDGMAEELDTLQEQVGIPVVFLEADVLHMEQMYRSLGQLLEGKNERGEELAALAADTLSFAETLREKIREDERVRVMFTTGADGLGTNAKGSSQAQVIELVGAENAVVVENVVNKGGGNVISMEQLYLFDPDIILFSPESYCDGAAQDPLWQPLTAVQNGRLYEIPAEPYNWMANPPSINMLLGVWWLGELAYPQYCEYDIAEKTQEIFSVLWDYTLSDEEVAALLHR
ncbi:MAG: ABC transporter substrate-binding protein, partial [Oscillospiraceae bacterium]|nr:ABC transporter substrate-binding protein [Oscillospiraceae bacterium]